MAPAPEPLPFVIRGTIWGGELRPAATVVSAYVEGELVAVQTIDASGDFNIAIPPGGYEGKKVTIKVSGELGTAEVEAGAVTRMDFNLGCMGNCCHGECGNEPDGATETENNAEAESALGLLLAIYEIIS